MAAVCLFAGRPAIQGELQALIGRMAVENRLWGQKRIQAELARLGFQVSARTVAKYMRVCHSRGPTGKWREFLTRHPTSRWAAQQIVEWHRAPPRFLTHDRDSRYGASFDRRVRGLGIRQVRTPFRSPRANAA